MNPNKSKTFWYLFKHHLDNHTTGNPKDFASKLGVSRATLYRFIADLRDEGVEIQFSRCQNCFYYSPSTLSELTNQALNEAFEPNNGSLQNPVDKPKHTTIYKQMERENIIVLHSYYYHT